MHVQREYKPLVCYRKGFTSLAAQRVFFDDANNATCKSRVGLYSVTFPCCPSQSGLFSASAVNVQEAHEYKRAIQLCSTDFYCTAVTSSLCVLYRRLAIKMVIVRVLSCVSDDCRETARRCVILSPILFVELAFSSGSF